MDEAVKEQAPVTPETPAEGQVGIPPSETQPGAAPSSDVVPSDSAQEPVPAEATGSDPVPAE